MSAKTERVTILTTPDFKDFLNAEAAKIGVSVSEFIRERCSGEPVNREDEILLAALVDQVNISTARAEKSLSKGLADVDAALSANREAKNGNY